MQTVFSGLITSKMRVRILMRLFLNPDQQVYQRELASEFNASSSQVSEELQQLSRAGLLESSRSGRRVNYRANREHALFPELQSMVKKALGMDRVLDSIIGRLGNLKCAFLLDDYAAGKDSGLIDLLLVGDIDRDKLEDLVRKTERYIDRKIRTLILTGAEYAKVKDLFRDRPNLKIWDSSGVNGNP